VWKKNKKKWKRSKKKLGGYIEKKLKFDAKIFFLFFFTPFFSKFEAK
jgi:hypothetical protein